MSASNVGDLGLIPGSGRSLGEGNGNPLQYYCLENPMDGEAWKATVHRVTKSRTRLSDFTSLHFTSCEVLSPADIYVYILINVFYVKYFSILIEIINSWSCCFIFWQVLKEVNGHGLPGQEYI